MHYRHCAPILFPCSHRIVINPRIVLKFVAHQNQKTTYGLTSYEFIISDVKYLRLNIVYHILHFADPCNLTLNRHTAKNLTVTELCDGVLLGRGRYQLVKSCALWKVVEFSGLICILDNVINQNIKCLVEALAPPLIGVLLDMCVVLQQLKIGSSHRLLDFLCLKNFYLFGMNLFEL